ncbi:MAG: 50S ribosomal protein L19 [Mycoplasmataceae bacterium]|jgi:large subunit ribosomal protein L19|nr:50S ribosomal protein L19 [Mycoplasmataceae bacterium]
MAKINKGELIKEVESTQLKDNVPEVRTGDTVSLHINITENNKSRIQKFEGVVMKTTGSGLTKSVTVRKDSSGVGVEQTFYLHSPSLVHVNVIRHGKVRRAYISYMRERSGKSAKIELKKTHKVA